jgi:outer membrane murein-binding lipoprotein Lpp
MYKIVVAIIVTTLVTGGILINKANKIVNDINNNNTQIEEMLENY